MMLLLMLCMLVKWSHALNLANYFKGSKLRSLHESSDNTSAAAANIKQMQARDIPFGKGKSLPCVVSRPTGTARPVGVVLAHGAGGDLTSGNLPRIAQRLASAGYFCIRFTCKPTRLPYRVKACQVLLALLVLVKLDRLKLSFALRGLQVVVVPLVPQPPTFDFKITQFCHLPTGGSG